MAVLPPQGQLKYGWVLRQRHRYPGPERFSLGTAFPKPQAEPPEKDLKKGHRRVKGNTDLHNAFQWDLGLGRQKACTTLRLDHCRACVCARAHTHTHTLPLTQTSELGQRDQGLVDNLKCEQRNKSWLDSSPVCPYWAAYPALSSQRQTPSRDGIFSRPRIGRT